MRFAEKRSKLMLGVAVLAVMLFGVVGAAQAAPVDTTSVPTQITLSAGTLSFITPITVAAAFNPLTLTGDAQNTTAAFTHFSVKNARGNKAGWSVNVFASQFATGAPDNYTLATNLLSMPQATVAELNASGPLPTITSGPYLIGVGTGVKIASADPTTLDKQGNGRYDFDAAGGDLTLAVPADTYAGAYTSTVTVDLNSGP